MLVLLLGQFIALSQTLEQLPLSIERYRLSVGTFFGVLNDYGDVNWSNQSSSNSFDFTSPMHYHHAPAFSEIGVRSLYRHIKTKSATRTPWFEKGSTGPYTFGGLGYFNRNLFDLNTAPPHPLFETSELTAGNHFLKPIIQNAHLHNQAIGLYHISMADFFFEIQRRTESLQPTGDVPLSPSYCLCRKRGGYLDPVFEDGTEPVPTLSDEDDVTQLNAAATNLGQDEYVNTRLTVSINLSQPTCGSADGSVTAIPSGGVSPITYDWSNNGAQAPDSDAATASNLSANTYTVTVTDATGCSATTSMRLLNSDGPALTPQVTQVPTCGNNDGKIKVIVQGGNPGNTFQWSGNGIGSFNVRINLYAGVYTVTVTQSSNNCTATMQFTLTNSDGPNVTATTTSVTCNNGSATATVTDGTSPFTYAWSNGGTTNSISALSVGTYTVTVTHANGCISTKEVVVAPKNATYSGHYLCCNCPEWRSTLLSRLMTMGNTGADYVIFDISHMPEKGCWCRSCREKFSQSSFCQYSEQTCKTHYVKGAGAGPLLADPLIKQAKTLRDFTNVSQMEHFGDVTKVLHYAGTVGIASVENLCTFISDEFRTDFASKAIDIPKTEWSIPIRQTYNSVFWGDEYEDPQSCPCNENVPCGPLCVEENSTTDCSDADLCLPSNYRTILPNYRIPEDIRIAAGMGMVRDASMYRLPFIWSPYHWKINTNETNGNHSIENNQRIKTWQGFAYSLGAITSFTMSNFFTSVDEGGTPVYKFNQRRLWDVWDQNGPVLNATFNHPNPNEVTNVFTLDEKVSAYLAYKRPYNWVGIYFSERERNRYLYAAEAEDPNTGNDYVVGFDAIPIPYNAPIASTNLDAQHEALAWWNQLLPLHGGFMALYNSNAPEIDDQNPYRTFKMPITFLTDLQVEEKKVDGYRAVLVPMPDEVGVSTFAALDQITQDHLAALDLPILPINHSSSWFQLNTLIPGMGPDNTGLRKHVRQPVINEVGMPDIYVSGATKQAATVHAGFLINEDNSEIVVPLTIQPMWGIPRTDELGVTNTQLQPSNSYNGEPLTIGDGDMLIHISALGELAPTSPTGITAKAIYSDLNIPDEPLEVTLDSASNELRIKVPAFNQFILIVINRN